MVVEPLTKHARLANELQAVDGQMAVRLQVHTSDRCDTGPAVTGNGDSHAGLEALERERKHGGSALGQVDDPSFAMQFLPAEHTVHMRHDRPAKIKFSCRLTLALPTVLRSERLHTEPIDPLHEN